MSTNPTSRSRRPAGTPTGGQFAPEAHAEPTVALGTTDTTPPDQPSEFRREVDAGGTVRWYDASDQFHRDGGPAIEYADGVKGWYQHGQLHRDGAPAIEYADGSTEWYQHGERVSPVLANAVAGDERGESVFGVDSVRAMVTGNQMLEHELADMDDEQVRSAARAFLQSEESEPFRAAYEDAVTLMLARATGLQGPPPTSQEAAQRWFDHARKQGG